MRSWRVGAEFFVAMAVGVTSVHADEAMTVADVQQICSSSEAANKAACRYYVLGIVQGLGLGMLIADGKAANGRRPCLPEAMSSSNLEILVRAKIGEDLAIYPDDRKLDAAGFIAGVMMNKFPCRTSPGK